MYCMYYVFILKIQKFKINMAAMVAVNALDGLSPVSNCYLIVSLSIIHKTAKTKHTTQTKIQIHTHTHTKTHSLSSLAGPTCCNLQSRRRRQTTSCVCSTCALLLNSSKVTCQTRSTSILTRCVGVYIFYEQMASTK